MPDNRHSVIGEGTDVGLIGGIVVAVWFLVLDTLAGHPFQTPSLLGQMVLLGDRTPDSQLAFGAILLYTAFHFIVFALIGMGLVALVHWGVDNPVVRYALLAGVPGLRGAVLRLPRGPVGAHPRAVPVLGGRDCQYAGGRLYGVLSLAATPGFPGVDPRHAAGGGARCNEPPAARRRAGRVEPRPSSPLWLPPPIISRFSAGQV